MSINQQVQEGSHSLLIVICFVAALGGFMFGFDTGVISGLTDSVKAQFKLSDSMEGFFVSCALLGCILGASYSGAAADQFGRKSILLLSGALFFFSGIGCGYPLNFPFLIVARFMGGVGIGTASVIAPLYISEIAPPKIRGTLVTFFQLAIVFGIFASYASNALIDSLPKVVPGWFPHPALSFIFVEENWRGMFLAVCVPAVLYTLLLLFIPESPRWHVSKGQDAKALDFLRKLLGDANGTRELDEIKTACNQEEGSFSELFGKRLRFGIVVGMLLMFFSQVTGINVIMYFGNQIFTEAGFSKEFSFWLQVIVGIGNIGFTFVAIWKIDQWGRKYLLKIGTISLFTILVLMALFFTFKDRLPEGSMFLYALPVMLVLFVAAFAMSWGPVPWVVVSEIFPTKIRGRAASIGTMTIWITCFLVAQTFPMIRAFGPQFCFGLYAFFMVLAMFFVWSYMPETKGKSLEEIERELYGTKRV